MRLGLILLAAAVIAAVWRAALPDTLRILLTGAALADALYLLRRHTGLWGAAQCSALVWDGAGWLWLRGVESDPVALLRATIWPGFMLLDFRCARPRRRRCLLLLSDSANADALRRLRIYLRHLPVFGD